MLRIRKLCAARLLEHENRWHDERIYIFTFEDLQPVWSSSNPPFSHTLELKICQNVKILSRFPPGSYGIHRNRHRWTVWVVSFIYFSIIITSIKPLTQNKGLSNNHRTRTPWRHGLHCFALASQSGGNNKDNQERAAGCKSQVSRSGLR
jgi:hypothetical protein